MGWRTTLCEGAERRAHCFGCIAGALAGRLRWVTSKSGGKRWMMKRLLAVCLVICGVASGSARAQEIPDWMKVRGDMLEESSALFRTEPTTEEALASRGRQSRARRILAAGAGLMITAAVTPAYVLPNREPCWGSDERSGRRPLLAATGVGAVGLVGVVGGATWLALESRRYGYRSSRRERAIAAGIGALAFALGQGLLGSMFLVDQVCHS